MLTDEQRRIIEAEEQLRHEVRRRLDTENPPPPPPEPPAPKVAFGKRVFEFFNSSVGMWLLSSVVLTGGASALAGIGELAEEIFEAPVRQGLPSSIGGLQDVVRSPMYSTGVGLVLFGLNQQRSARGSHFRIRDNSIFGRVKQRMREWFYAEFD